MVLTALKRNANAHSIGMFQFGYIRIQSHNSNRLFHIFANAKTVVIDTHPAYNCLVIARIEFVQRIEITDQKTNSPHCVNKLYSVMHGKW